MKKQFKKLHETTVKTTVSFLRWIFFLIFLYIGFTIIFGLWFKGMEFFSDVITFSVSGFFAFFMGYFGWRLAEIIEEWLKKTRGEKNE